MNRVTLQGINIIPPKKRKIIFKTVLGGDMFCSLEGIMFWRSQECSKFQQEMQVNSFQEDVCWMGTMGFQGGWEIGAFSSIPSPKQHLYYDRNVLVLRLFLYLCGITYCSHSGSGFGWSTPSLTPAWGIILHHTSLKNRDYQSPMSSPSLTPASGIILHHTSLKN